MSKIREKESLEYVRMHIWASKTQKLPGPLSGPWTPAAECSLHSRNSASLCRQLSASEAGAPPLTKSWIRTCNNWCLWCRVLCIRSKGIRYSLTKWMKNLVDKNANEKKVIIEWINTEIIPKKQSSSTQCQCFPFREHLYNHLHVLVPLPVNIGIYFSDIPVAELVSDKRQIHGIMRIFFARVFVLVVVCTRTVTSFVRVKDSELSSVLQGRFRAYPCGSTSVTLPAVEKFDQFFKISGTAANPFS